MTTTTLGITGMTCGHCVAAVDSALSALPGVETVDVDLEAGTATVGSDGPLDLAAAEKSVADAGYGVAPEGGADEDPGLGANLLI